MTAPDYKKLDSEDELAPLRNEFYLPGDKVYLDGNSLGALPLAVKERVLKVVEQEWGGDLISSWNKHDWIGMPTRVGEKIAGLIGAAPGQVICCDSVSVNLFKLLCSALELQRGEPGEMKPRRHVVLSQQDNFPTDLYAVEGVSSLLGSDRCSLRTVPAGELESALGEDVAVLLLTHVNFRDGRLHDMQALTRAAHEQGVLVLWDLCHSAGVIPLELDAWGVDMAVGCGYKYLNGGPGAPAFLYLARRHHDQASQPLSGWMGHKNAFEFEPGYRPAEGVKRYLSGTPGILGMSALDTALNLFDSVSITALREKSCALTGLFIEEFAASPGLGDLRLVSPSQAAERGSQVSLAHGEAYAICQALIEAGVVVDFRAPDILRFGFSPMYNRFGDVATALAALEDIMRDQRFLEARYRQRAAVT
jgi:kynureninase